MKDNKKSKTAEILNNVTLACSKIKYGINANKVAVYTGYKWSTCKNHLDMLQVLSIIDYDKAGTFTYYGLTADYFDRYVQLNREREELIKALNVIKKFTKINEKEFLEN